MAVIHLFRHRLAELLSMVRGGWKPPAGVVGAGSHQKKKKQ